MIVKVFSIYDEKGVLYSAPFFLPHIGQAARSFGDLVQDDKSSIHKHPSDYKLYELGEFDDTSGKLCGYDVPRFIANASDFINKEV